MHCRRSSEALRTSVCSSACSYRRMRQHQDEVLHSGEAAAVWRYVPGSEWLTTAGQAELWSQKEFVLLLSGGSPFTQVFPVQAQRTIFPLFADDSLSTRPHQPRTVTRLRRRVHLGLTLSTSLSTPAVNIVKYSSYTSVQTEG